VLLDIIMPELDGYQVLEQMKADGRLRHIPVIVISAEQELDSVVKGIELGAQDYLPKTFDPVLLKARINASLEKKRWRDKEQAYLAEIEAEREKSERLLLNILPQPIAERLKQQVQTIVDRFAEVTVLFADLVGFTALAAEMPPDELTVLLNEIFSTFDRLAEAHEVEKIKTIGDAYAFEERGPVQIKGKGELMTYFLTGRKQTPG
jgi:adenylate cyclase